VFSHRSQNSIDPHSDPPPLKQPPKNYSMLLVPSNTFQMYFNVNIVYIFIILPFENHNLLQNHSTQFVVASST